MGDPSQKAFNVNVKVEEVDDEINTEETNESLNNVTNKQYHKPFYTQVISTDDTDNENITSKNSNSATEPTCNQEDNSNEIAASSSAFNLEICNSLGSDKEKNFYVIHKNYIYTLTRKTILKGIEEQTKSLKSESELLLNKFTRTQHPEYYIHTKTVHEYLLDNAIELWRNWSERNTQLRNTPLSYKCYVCNKGWWRLNPFRQHITIHKHPQFLISFEGGGNEGNIVASIGYPKMNNLVRINGNCWKCDKPYENHALTVSMKYTCGSCWMDYKTCVELAQHACDPSLNDHSAGMLCNLCPMNCPNKDKLYRHKVLYHTPKSDEPAIIQTKICNLCEEKYFFVAYHDCPKRSKLYKCDFCWNKYVSKPLQELHMSLNKGYSKCPGCSRNFRNCFLIEHLIEHSNNYGVMQYCNKCKHDVLYIDKHRFARHMVKHQTEIRKKRYTVKMLLPMKCYQGIIYDSAIPLEISGSHLLVYLDNAGYTNYTLPELLVLIHKLRLQNARNKKKITETKKTEIQNKCRNLEQSDLNKKITEKQIIVNSVLNNSQDEIEFGYQSDNALQDQLDAEIKKDVEIENKISKLFKTSSIYKKFLDKEANEPIDEYDAGIIDKKDVFVISDSDSETPQKIDSICEDIPDVNMINRLNFNMIDETNINNTIVKIECNIIEKKCNEVQDTNESLREIKKENFDIEIKEEIEVNENLVIDFKTESSILDDENVENVEREIEISDNTIKVSNNVKKKASKKDKHQTDLRYSCTNCSYTGIYEDFIAHLLSCRSKYIKCTYCKKTFPDIKSYLTHFPKHKLKYLSCPQCMRKFSVLRNLNNHILTHVHELFSTIPEDSEKYIDSNQFLCYVCDNIVEIDNFFIHWESHLELTEVIVDEVSENNSELKSMMTPEMVEQALAILSDTKRDNKNKTCIVCSKVNVKKNDSKRHLTEHLLHEAKVKMIAEGGQLSCPMCDQEIEELSTWRQHVREHAHIKTYRCSLCPKKFSDSSNYSKHRKVHNQHKYICDLCGGKFCAKSSIIRHLKNHEPMNSVKCPTCYKILPSEHRLKRHMKIRHIPFFFACHVCNRKFSTCKEKWDHLWNKHKIRKYVADCPLCNKQYRRLIDVKTHMKFMHGIDKTEGSYNTTYYDVKNKTKIKRQAKKKTVLESCK